MTCEHLLPLEEALLLVDARETFRGPAWSNDSREWVYFQCCLARAQIREQLGFEECVVDHDHLGTHDGQESGFICTVHHDGIIGIHPKFVDGTVPVFTGLLPPLLAPKEVLICDGANLPDCDFSDYVRQGLCCMYARFDRSFLCRADLYWALMVGTSFVGCDLTDTDFSGANLEKTDFREARLIRTNFGPSNLGGGCKLQGADLSTAVIQSCHFTGAEYDSETKFPRGFSPAKHGLNLVERN